MRNDKNKGVPKADLYFIAPIGAPGMIQTYSFFSIFNLPQFLKRASVVWGCTRLRLVSDAC